MFDHIWSCEPGSRWLVVALLLHFPPQPLLHSGFAFAFCGATWRRHVRALSHPLGSSWGCGTTPASAFSTGTWLKKSGTPVETRTSSSFWSAANSWKLCCSLRCSHLPSQAAELPPDPRFLFCKVKGCSTLSLSWLSEQSKKRKITSTGGRPLLLRNICKSKSLSRRKRKRLWKEPRTSDLSLAIKVTKPKTITGLEENWLTCSELSGCEQAGATDHADKDSLAQARRRLFKHT